MTAVSGTGGGSRTGSGALMALPATIVVFLIILLPLVQMFRYSLDLYDPIDMVKEALTLQNYGAFLSDQYFIAIFAATIKVALICTAASLLLGFPVAYFLARSGSRFKGMLIILLILPMFVGGVVRAAGWMVILGNAGFVNAVLVGLGLTEHPIRLMYTPFAVMVATTGIVLPYMILTLQSVLTGIDYTMEEAARNLGADTVRVFMRVLLPLAAPGIAASTMLVFILCMNMYVTPVLLGGTGLTMMAPAVYDEITKAANWPFGAALAFILMFTTLTLALASSYLIQSRYMRTMVSS